MILNYSSHLDRFDLKRFETFAGSFRNSHWNLKKEYKMSVSIKSLRSLAKISVLTMGLGTSHAQLSESLYELSNFGITMGNFTNSLNQLMHSRSPQEQQQIQRRLEYVERMATMQAYSLESFIAADEAMASSQQTWYNFFGTGGDDAALDQVYQSFKQYQSVFSDHSLRAMGQFPMPAYERLYIRWKQTPASNQRMKEYAKQQFLSVFRAYARRFVYTTQQQLQTKRRRFLSALKSVQNSGPFAMNDKVSFDKAFWDYQQMFKERTEPRQGDIFIPEFPYNYMMTTQQQPNFVYNQSIYEQSGLNQFGYGATAGMGYQVGAGSMGMQAGMINAQGAGYQMGSGFVTSGAQEYGRYATVSPTYQADQVVPLAGTAQQLSSPYGAFAPSTSSELDARLLQEIYLRQRQYEQGSSAGNMQDINTAYSDYSNLRNQWFSQ